MEHLEKWRLILGEKSDPEQQITLPKDAQGIDRTLNALYDSDRRGGLGNSMPNVNRWLGDIRTYFPSSIVQVMQRDALQRLKLTQMLLEPELLDSVIPDIHLAAALLQLQKALPDQTRETARAVVRKVVEQIQERLREPMRQAVQGAIHRAERSHRPRWRDVNWPLTIRANLRHYQPEHRAIIPQILVGHGRRAKSMRTVILLIDQSGSMSTSVVYAGVLGCILASLHSIRTHIVAFDTEVVDLTHLASDPVDVLFGTQLGGGTDIQKALKYAQTLALNPADTTLFLISDLYEGTSGSQLLQRIDEIVALGVRIITLLALSDQGQPAYDRNMAAEFATRGAVCFGCTPDAFPDVLEAALGGQDIKIPRT